jgi:hypothetical protein
LKYHQGYFKPKNPQKYVGDPEGIIFRSGFEKRFFAMFDQHEHILEWGSEELSIQYFYPVDMKTHRYFPDCYIKYRTKTGAIQKALVEMKPSDFCKKPTKPKTITKSYVRAVNEYIKNVSKWKAASEFCRIRGWKFIILNERDLNYSKK